MVSLQVHSRPRGRWSCADALFAILTWHRGGWIKEFEAEAQRKHETLNSGVLYGFFNGARGLGYLAGGIAGSELLQLGGLVKGMNWGYSTRYGTIILFTGISSLLGGAGIFSRGCEQVEHRRQRRRQTAISP